MALANQLRAFYVSVQRAPSHVVVRPVCVPCCLVFPKINGETGLQARELEQQPSACKILTGVEDRPSSARSAIEVTECAPNIDRTAETAREQGYLLMTAVPIVGTLDFVRLRAFFLPYISTTTGCTQSFVPQHRTSRPSRLDNETAGSIPGPAHSHLSSLADPASAASSRNGTDFDPHPLSVLCISTESGAEWKPLPRGKEGTKENSRYQLLVVNTIFICIVQRVSDRLWCDFPYSPPIHGEGAHLVSTADVCRSRATLRNQAGARKKIPLTKRTITMTWAYKEHGAYHRGEKTTWRKQTLEWYMCQC